MDIHNRLELNNERAGDLFIRKRDDRFHITVVTPDDEIWGMSTKSEAVVVGEIQLFEFRSKQNGNTDNNQA